MIKASHPLKADEVDEVDDLLNEIAPSPWFIVQNSVTLEAVLEAYFPDLPAFIEYKSDQNDEISRTLKLHEQFQVLEIKEPDWAESYKKHFTPWQHKGFHWIPLWLEKEYVPPIEEKRVYIDPGMAFGTGNHETTKLCLEELINLEHLKGSKDSLLDLGCGSGIISITASKLGFTHVVGIDNDSDAVRIAYQNAKLNADSVSLFVNSSVQNFKNQSTFDCVVANIQSDILMDASDKIVEFVAQNGRLFLSGILDYEAEEVAELFLSTADQLALRVSLNRRDLNEWSLLDFDFRK